jgi:poly(3-hydroxyalkanoate) synthetase
LYDSPPIIGEIYREFAEYCYKQNLLIKNKMKVVLADDINNNNDIVTINLKNIDMPFLNIVAEKDDLVAPNSSKALNNVLTESHDKSLIEFKSGHVGLMIGNNAHKELWPKVGEWIKNHCDTCHITVYITDVQDGADFDKKYRGCGHIQKIDNRALLESSNDNNIYREVS